MKKIGIITLVISLLAIISLGSYFIYKNQTIQKTDVLPTNTYTAIPNDETTTISFDDVTSMPDKIGVDLGVENNFVVIGHIESYNTKEYDRFLSELKDKKDTSIKVIQYTVEGDALLTKIIYSAKENKFYSLIDSTRDKFSSISSRICYYNEFTELKTEEYQTSDTRTITSYYFTDEEGKDITLFCI